MLLYYLIKLLLTWLYHVTTKTVNTHNKHTRLLFTDFFKNMLMDQDTQYRHENSGCMFILILVLIINMSELFPTHIKESFHHKYSESPAVGLTRLFPSNKRQHDATEPQRVQQSSVHTKPEPERSGSIRWSFWGGRGESFGPDERSEASQTRRWTSDLSAVCHTLETRRKCYVGLAVLRSPTIHAGTSNFLGDASAEGSERRLNRSWLRVCCGFNAIEVCLTPFFICFRSKKRSVIGLKIHLNAYSHRLLLLWSLHITYGKNAWREGLPSVWF